MNVKYNFETSCINKFFICKLGNDVFGKDYVENFKKNNINTKHVFLTDEAATGVAPICVDNNGKEKFAKASI